MTSTSATLTVTKPPLRFFVTLLELAALGAVGGAVFGALAGVLATGTGLLFVLGIGVFVLIGLVYAFFGVAWFEIERVRALYGLDGAPLRWRDQGGTGFVDWLRSVWGQLGDVRMWLALASFAIASILGAALLGLVKAILWFGVILVRGAIFGAEVNILGRGVIAEWSVVVAILGIAGCVLGIFLLVLLHRVLSRALIVPGREEQLVEQVRASSVQREGAVRAAELERTRIERDLHDGVQPRLVSIGMTLGLAQQKIDTDPAAAKLLITEAHTSTKAAITELRQLARGIHASVLDDRGLDAALSALAGRSHIPVTLDVRMAGRCSRAAEAAVYFAVAESLTNAAKHSHASDARVQVRSRDDGTLWARVDDNGVGGATVQPGGGLDGILNRITAAGGTVRLDSPQGGPTSLEVSVPCAS